MAQSYSTNTLLYSSNNRRLPVIHAPVEDYFLVFQHSTIPYLADIIKRATQMRYMPFGNERSIPLDPRSSISFIAHYILNMKNLFEQEDRVRINEK